MCLLNNWNLINNIGSYESPNFNGNLLDFQIASAFCKARIWHRIQTATAKLQV